MLLQKGSQGYVGDPRLARAPVPWVRESELGLGYDDSASAAARRSALKSNAWTLALEGSLHRLVHTSGLQHAALRLA